MKDGKGIVVVWLCDNIPSPLPVDADEMEERSLLNLVRASLSSFLASYLCLGTILNTQSSKLGGIRDPVDFSRSWVEMRQLLLTKPSESMYPSPSTEKRDTTAPITNGTCSEAISKGPSTSAFRKRMAPSAAWNKAFDRNAPVADTSPPPEMPGGTLVGEVPPFPNILASQREKQKQRQQQKSTHTRSVKDEIIKKNTTCNNDKKGQ